jgi:hypothetical protein
MMNEEIAERMDAVASNPESAVMKVEGVDPNGAALTRDEMEALLAMQKGKATFTDTFTQEIALPSCGYFGGPSKVLIRRMTMREEEILYLSDSNPTYLDDLALSCIVSPTNISLDQLHPNDLLYILFAIRNISFDATYKQNSICPMCKQAHIETVDITTLPIKFLDSSYVNLMKDVKLPVSGDTITLNILTEGQLLKLDEKIQREIKMNKITNPDQAKLYALQMRREALIDKINGGEFESLEAKRKYINSMLSKDYNRLNNYSNKIRESFGLDRSLEVKCPHCGRPYESEAVMVPEFFRPSDED